MAMWQKQERIQELAKNMRLAISEVYGKKLEEFNEKEIGELFEGMKIIQEWLEKKLFVI